eukprot:m.125920 g.125920  ORF g.125920 m.125920 type:complete len:307 (+) comp29166_c0_seq2:172-1092(+)
MADPVSPPEVHAPNLPDDPKPKTPKMNELDVKNLQNLCKFEFHKHRLSHEKLKFYQFYAFDGPIALLTLATGILAFLAGSSITNDTNTTTNTGNVDANIDAETRQIFALVVGALAVLSVFMQKVSSIFNYGSRSDMHHAASMDLKHMIDELKLQTLALQVAKHSNAPDHEAVSIEAYQIRFQQILESNKSLIPLRISSAFDLCVEKLNMRLHHVSEETAADLMGAVITEVSTRITSTCLWPLGCTCILGIKSEKLVDDAIKKIIGDAGLKDGNNTQSINETYSHHTAPEDTIHAGDTILAGDTSIV